MRRGQISKRLPWLEQPAEAMSAKAFKIAITSLV